MFRYLYMCVYTFASTSTLYVIAINNCISIIIPAKESRRNSSDDSKIRHMEDRRICRTREQCLLVWFSCLFFLLFFLSVRNYFPFHFDYRGLSFGIHPRMLFTLKKYCNTLKCN